MLEIYHVDGSGSGRLPWWCFELDLPVQASPGDFAPELHDSPIHDSPTWRVISPAGRLPLMST